MKNTRTKEKKSPNSSVIFEIIKFYFNMYFNFLQHIPLLINFKMDSSAAKRRSQKIFLQDITSTNKAVLFVLNRESAKPKHIIPPHRFEMLKGRVQRAIKALKKHNQRVDAIALHLQEYKNHSESLIVRYCRTLRIKNCHAIRQSILNEYSDLLNATLDVELLNEVRLTLSGGVDADEKVGSIASRMDINDNTPGFVKVVCELCNNDEHFTVDHRDQMTCSVCFGIINRLDDTRKPQHPLSNTFAPYDRTASFREIIRRYQGQRSTKISQDVIDRVCTWLKEHNIAIENATRQDVTNCLMEYKMSSEYKDAVIIHSLVTKCRVASIHHLEDELIYDYCCLLDEYALMNDGEPKTLEHLHFLLYLLLKKHNHPCKHTDFPSTTPFSTIDINYNTYSELFSRLNWPYRL